MAQFDEVSLNRLEDAAARARSVREIIEDVGRVALNGSPAAFYLESAWKSLRLAEALLTDAQEEHDAAWFV